MSDQSNRPEGFFGKTFWQQMLIAWSGHIVALVLAAVVSLWIGGQIAKLTALAESVKESTDSIVELIKLGPGKIKEVGSAIQDTAGETGEAIGEGAATVVDRVGTAFDRFTGPATE